MYLKQIDKALIVCPTFYGGANKRNAYHHAPPLGPGIVTTILREHGIDARFFDVMERDEDFAQVVGSFQPDMIGVFCMTSFYPEFAATIRLIRDEFGFDGLLIAGGPHITLEPEKTLAQLPIDIAMIGEAEDTLVDLVAKLGNKTSTIEDVPGLYTLETGFTGARPLIDLSKAIPCDYSVFEWREYLSGLPPVEIARGCPNGCVYCSSSSIYRRKVRYRSIDQLEHTLRELRDKFRFREFRPVADTFIANKKWVKEFCERIAPLDMTFNANGYTNLVDRDTLRALRSAGCQNVNYGIETANSQILENICKRQDPERIEEVIKMTLDEGMSAHLWFMLSLPGETAEDIRNNIEYANRLKDKYDVEIEFQICRVYPKTPLAEMLHLDVLDWADMRHPSLRYPNVPLYLELSEQEVVSLYRIAEKACRKRTALSGRFRQIEQVWRNSRNLGDFAYTITKKARKFVERNLRAG